MQKFGESLWELGLSKRNENGGVGKDAKEIADNYLLAEVESDFIFLFFLISEINFGLKIISGNPEILIKSRKILKKLRKIQENY
jgi:hypothetical protein